MCCLFISLLVNTVSTKAYSNLVVVLERDGSVVPFNKTNYKNRNAQILLIFNWLLAEPPGSPVLLGLFNEPRMVHVLPSIPGVMVTRLLTGVATGNYTLGSYVGYVWHRQIGDDK